MQDLFRQLADTVIAGHPAALCVVVKTRGSTPQERGAKMLVRLDGTTAGTLGGGCVEAEVRRVTLGMIEQRDSRLLTFHLDHDYGWDDGLICGGVMEIAVRVVAERDEAERFAELSRAIAHERTSTLRFEYSSEAGPQVYVEELLPSPVVVIAGAGHVGQALATQATACGFVVDVIDDREDVMSQDRFPTARRRIAADIETALRDYPANDRTYIVIVTRGHRHDGRALAAVIDKPAKYVGLIGSTSKIKQIMDDLHRSGVPREKLLAVHAPIGLQIGSVTVPEIALSIAAELVAARRGRANQPANPMKISGSQLTQWLDRNR